MSDECQNYATSCFYKGPHNKELALEIFKEITADWISLLTNPRKPIPLAKLLFKTECAGNWAIPIHRCFADTIDWRLTPRFENKQQYWEWTQGSAFCFECGDVIWLDREGYSSGHGNILQIKENLPAIPAAGEAVGKWAAWPDNIDELAKIIEASGARSSREYIKAAPKNERYQLRKFTQRLPGKIKADRFESDGKNMQKVTSYSFTQDEFVKALITGEGLL